MKRVYTFSEDIVVCYLMPNGTWRMVLAACWCDDAEAEAWKPEGAHRWVFKVNGVVRGDIHKGSYHSLKACARMWRATNMVK